MSMIMTMRSSGLVFLLLPFLSVFFMHTNAFYVSHVLRFPAIPFSAGMHHIHSPMHFMEAHGFALPGFEILDTLQPNSMGDYVTMEFSFKTRFNCRLTARVFSSSLNKSHILLMDPDGIPCLLGTLSVGKCSPNDHLQINAHADLLRPASVWERIFGGERLVKQSEVERCIKAGYTNFKYDVNCKSYFHMVIACSKKQSSSE